MDLKNPIFKMALSGLKTTMQTNGIKKVIFEFDTDGNPQIEVAPDDLSVKEFERLKESNEMLKNLINQTNE